MIEVTQTKFGKGGNCLQAVLASLLEVDLGTVPAFEELKEPEGYDEPFPLWYIVLANYLKERGFQFLEIDLHKDRPWNAPPYPFTCIFGGYDVNGDKHAVIGQCNPTGEFEVLWNPACQGNREDPGITSVESVCILVPISPADMSFAPPPSLVIPTVRDMKKLTDGKGLN